jgi:hypothetical protein
MITNFIIIIDEKHLLTRNMNELQQHIIYIFDEEHNLID